MLANHAPVLVDTGVHPLFNVARGDVNSEGTSVFLVAGTVEDEDGLLGRGIAVTSVDGANGSWQYSTDVGTNWHALAGASVDAARLLVTGDYVRFVPAAGFVGDATFTFVAWDGTTGTAGSTADVNVRGGETGFSENSATASVTVYETVVTPPPPLPPPPTPKVPEIRAWASD